MPHPGGCDMLAYSFKAKLTTIIALSMMAPIAWGQSVSAPSDQAQQTVVVKRGDSLWSISKNTVVLLQILKLLTS